MSSKTKMESGWYLNGRAWFWNGSRFTDWIAVSGAQMSYGEWTPGEREENKRELIAATAQVGDMFVSLNGPWEFDQVCDGERLLDPAE